MIDGFNHVGISVSDLHRSIAFYRNSLGMEVVAQMRFEGERYEAILGLEGARGEAALLRSGSLQLELFEFAHPAPKSADPRRPVCDHGITHFCVDVADIDTTYDRLKAAGVFFHCPPLDFGRARATYGRDPDGNVFELRQKIGTAPPVP